MPTPISINIPHSLGKDEARRRIRSGFDRLRTHLTGGLSHILDIREQWEGDRLHISGGSLGQRVTGRLDVLHDSVQIEIDLPPLLAAFARTIAERLRREGQRLLQK